MIKKVIKYFLIGLIILLFLLLPVLFQSVDPVQKRPPFISYTFPDTLSGIQFNMDSLINAVGNNKGLPQGFELAALLAYSAYPELKPVNIDMVLTESGAPMESNFNLKTLLDPIEKRQYKILLNNATNTNYDPILLRSLPFDAQVGILAHELGHVVYYHELTTLQLAKWGLMYLINPVFRAKHERSTDMMPVYHGLGSQIYQYAHYVRKDVSTAPMYEKYGWLMDKFYMNDDELLEAISKNDSLLLDQQSTY